MPIPCQLFRALIYKGFFLGIRLRSYVKTVTCVTGTVTKGNEWVLDFGSGWSPRWCVIVGGFVWFYVVIVHRFWWVVLCGESVGGICACPVCLRHGPKTTRLWALAACKCSEITWRFNRKCLILWGFDAQAVAAGNEISMIYDDLLQFRWWGAWAMAGLDVYVYTYIHRSGIFTCKLQVSSDNT